MTDTNATIARWFAELRRRKVVRVAIVYIVIAWLLIQVADATFETIGLPTWANRLVIVLAMLGFPLACGLAWAFDVTPRGIERTPAPDARSRGTPGTTAGPALGAAAWLAPQPAVAAVASLPGTGNPSVAILPFADMSAARDQEYFCDGIAEEIINALCCVRGLQVASRTSSFQFKGVRPTCTDWPLARRHRRARSSVRRSEERTHHLQLVSAPTAFISGQARPPAGHLRDAGEIAQHRERAALQPDPGGRRSWAWRCAIESLRVLPRAAAA
jgi:TolB-like protein